MAFPLNVDMLSSIVREYQPVDKSNNAKGAPILQFTLGEFFIPAGGTADDARPGQRSLSFNLHDADHRLALINWLTQAVEDAELALDATKSQPKPAPVSGFVPEWKRKLMAPATTDPDRQNGPVTTIKPDKSAAASSSALQNLRDRAKAAL
jgi:hypothetical protein